MPHQIVTKTAIEKPKIGQWRDRFRHRARHFETGRGRAASRDRKCRSRICARIWSEARRARFDRRARCAQCWSLSGRTIGDIIAAVEALEKMRGGQVAVADGKVEAALPLPIAGLVSDQPLEAVIEKIAALNAAASETWAAICPRLS